MGVGSGDRRLIKDQTHFFFYLIWIIVCFEIFGIADGYGPIFEGEIEKIFGIAD